MMSPVLFLPWHITDRLVDGLNATMPAGTRVIDAAPTAMGDAWRDLVPLYAPLADAIAASSEPVTVLSGDCVTALAVLAGCQRRGDNPGLVWFDAHGDFHTEGSTTSGYLGGLPLAKAVGRGDMTLPAALGLEPLAEERVMLVDGRDLDPAEVEALAGSALRRASVSEAAALLPEVPLHVHVDLDVLDPSLLPGLRFPAPGGANLAMLSRAVRDIVEARDVRAISIAATWRPADADRVCNDRAIGAILDAITGSVA